MVSLWPCQTTEAAVAGRVITLLRGDCLKLLPDVPFASVDMVLCDLPSGLVLGEQASQAHLRLQTVIQQIRRLPVQACGGCLFGVRAQRLRQTFSLALQRSSLLPGKTGKSYCSSSFERRGVDTHDRSIRDHASAGMGSCASNSCKTKRIPTLPSLRFPPNALTGTRACVPIVEAA